MARSKADLLQALSDYVVNLQDDEIGALAQEYIDAGYDALEGIDGLVDGMNRAGKLYEQDEYFVTELLVCSDAMYNGLEILKPHLAKDFNEGKRIYKCVIGVIEGDTHDIGKNLVKIMLETSGFEMLDLGRDVPLHRFIDKAKEERADLICLSTLMTTTMPGMKEVVDMLKREEALQDVKIMIGGGPVSQSFCNKIGAHGYSANATEAVKLAKTLVGLNG